MGFETPRPVRWVARRGFTVNPPCADHVFTMQMRCSCGDSTVKSRWIHGVSAVSARQLLTTPLSCHITFAVASMADLVYDCAQADADRYAEGL